MFTFAAIRQTTPFVRGDGLLLRCPQQADYAEWRDLRLRSRDFLMPFEPRWPETELSLRNFTARVRRNRRDATYGTEFSFLIFMEDRRGSTLLVGGMTLSNIRRRAAQNVSLGYWMGEEFAGRGIMKRAVALILPFVFDTLNLHRIEAACVPDNMASRRVLTGNGFREIGLAENYLQIDGRWRDHVLFALTREHYDGVAG